jgi:hypothetical protein
MGSMDSEEKLVFDQIKGAGNMGQSPELVFVDAPS